MKNNQSIPKLVLSSVGCAAALSVFAFTLYAQDAPAPEARANQPMRQHQGQGPGQGGPRMMQFNPSQMLQRNMDMALMKQVREEIKAYRNEPNEENLKKLDTALQAAIKVDTEKRRAALQKALDTLDETQKARFTTIMDRVKNSSQDAPKGKDRPQGEKPQKMQPRDMTPPADQGENPPPMMKGEGQPPQGGMQRGMQGDMPRGMGLPPMMEMSDDDMVNLVIADEMMPAPAPAPVEK